jgi:hypothetical protein
MSRRNQSRRRRTYGRRQHEVRERRLDARPADGWLGGTAVDGESDWQSAELLDDPAAYRDSFGGFGR